MVRSCAPVFGLLTIFLGPVFGYGQAHAEIHCQRARLYCCLPAWDYAEDHVRIGKSVIAVADATVQKTWLEYKVPRPLEPMPKYDSRWNARKKRFHFPVNSLAVDHVILDRVGLAIYDTGLTSCTGRIRHNGGPDGDLQSNCVVIRLRAYAAPIKGGPLLNAPVVWQSLEHRIRVRRDRPVVVSLVRDIEGQSPPLRRHFEEITHLEVELQYQRDR